MDETLKMALATPEDYSSIFTAVVEDLRTKVAEALEVEIYRDGHMNYGSAQKIELWFDQNYKCVEDYVPFSARRDASFKIATFISSKGKYFATGCRAKDPNPSRTWRIVPNSMLNPIAQSYVEKNRISVRNEWLHYASKRGNVADCRRPQNKTRQFARDNISGTFQRTRLLIHKARLKSGNSRTCPASPSQRAAS